MNRVAVRVDEANLPNALTNGIVACWVQASTYGGSYSIGDIVHEEQMARVGRVVGAQFHEEMALVRYFPHRLDINRPKRLGATKQPGIPIGRPSKIAHRGTSE